ncbi:MAG TPA: RNA polymerase sigma factor [Solirubrobacteraceae bacterium]|jgi:RNA polymerase sigma-70 factor (ECF subfamily)|nr:RNA polymerase sigma factor [Solirubrobacteraceae bacterium]
MPRLDPESLHTHVDRLFRAAWALCGRREDAEDLVQETFARVLSRPRMLHGDDELAYLMRVLRNTYLTSRRTAARRPRTVPAPETEPEDPRSSDHAERALMAGELLAAIADLPEDLRLAVAAVDLLGLSYAQAGRVLDAREATIATRLFRARAQLAERLGDPRDSGREASSANRSLNQ